MLTRFFCRVRGLFRRWFPALLAGALCLAYYQYTAYQEAHRAVLAAQVKAGFLEADSATVAAAHNTAVPPFGLVAGKLVFAFGLFFAGIAAVWFVLRFVMPVLPRWATGGYKERGPSGVLFADYKEAFLGLDFASRLRTFNTVWLALLGYWALCVLAACLVS